MAQHANNNEIKPFLIPKIVFRAPAIKTNPMVTDFLSKIQQLNTMKN